LVILAASAAALAGVALVVAVAATVQLTAGFGFGLAAVPLMAVVLDPHDAVVVALTLATFTNGYQAWSGRHHADRGVIGRILSGAVVGLPIGLLVFLRVDDRVLSAVIGTAVLVAVVAIARGLDLRHAGPGLDVGAGVLSGALTMSAGVNGPPLVFMLQARHFDPVRFRATIASVFFVLDVVSVTVFAATGDLDADVIRAVAVALPGLALGAVVGIWLRRHLDAVRFRRLVLVLLTIAGVSAIVAAITE
jgi:uncharacterized membrane protein YfcA